MTREFAGRVALITGRAGDGIGQACARRLAAAGATIVLVDEHEARTKSVFESIAAGTGATVVGFPGDIADRDRMDEVIALAEDQTDCRRSAS